jgi:hypothetical protein
MPSKSGGWKVTEYIPILSLLMGKYPFSGPYLMISTFVVIFLMGIYCVKRVCLQRNGIKSLMHEVRVIKRKI